MPLAERTGIQESNAQGILADVGRWCTPSHDLTEDASTVSCIAGPFHHRLCSMPNDLGERPPPTPMAERAQRSRIPAQTQTEPLGSGSSQDNG